MLVLEAPVAAGLAGDETDDVAGLGAGDVAVDFAAAAPKVALEAVEAAEGEAGLTVEEAGLAGVLVSAALGEVVLDWVKTEGMVTVEGLVAEAPAGLAGEALDAAGFEVVEVEDVVEVAGLLNEVVVEAAGLEAVVVAGLLNDEVVDVVAAGLVVAGAAVLLCGLRQGHEKQKEKEHIRCSRFGCSCCGSRCTLSFVLFLLVSPTYFLYLFADGIDFLQEGQKSRCQYQVMKRRNILLSTKIANLEKEKRVWQGLCIVRSSKGCDIGR